MPEDLWSSVLVIGAVWLVTVVSPGPNFLATCHAALNDSRRSGVLVALGVGVGTAVWAVASLLGLGLLFQSAAWLYGLVKLAGGLYLIWLGIRTLLGSGSVSSDAPDTAGPSGRGAFRRGLVVDLSNPKAAVFFVSLFAVAVPPEAPFWFDALVVTMVVVTAFAWYATVACLVNLPPVAAVLRRWQAGITRITGALFVVLGVRLAVDR